LSEIISHDLAPDLRAQAGQIADQLAAFEAALRLAELQVRRLGRGLADSRARLQLDCTVELQPELAVDAARKSLADARLFMVQAHLDLDQIRAELGLPDLAIGFKWARSLQSAAMRDGR
jgi:hypothetical protein